MPKGQNPNTTVSNESPSPKKLEVNPRTTLCVFTGGIDSTYLLYLMKSKFEDVGANLKDLIPVWFENASQEQLSIIKETARSLGLEPLLLPASPTVSYSPKDYLIVIANYALDNGIKQIYTALTNDEALSEIPDLDYATFNSIETKVKDERKKKLSEQENVNPEEIEKINQFHIEFPIVGLNKSVIIRRLMDVHKFDIGKTYRHKNDSDVHLTLLNKDKSSVNKLLDEIRKRGFRGTRFKDPLEKAK